MSGGKAGKAVSWVGKETGNVEKSAAAIARILDDHWLESSLGRAAAHLDTLEHVRHI